MATITSTTVDVERNPSHLPARFEIRRLKPEHAEWAKSIVLHSNMYHSPVWPLLYPSPEIQAQKCYEGMKTATYLVDHQIASRMSFGVFDTEYKFKRPESAATDGKLYWDENDTSATGAELLEQMDFPLASIALAYDQINPLDMNEIMKLVATLPQFGTVYHMLGVLDKRDPESWSAKAPKQVLMRNATSTRHDYEGYGIMKKQAHFLMREAKLEGFGGIQIECLHDAVTKTWLNPPSPFKGELVSSLAVDTYEEKNEQGETVYPFRPSTQVASKVFVHL